MRANRKRDAPCFVRLGQEPFFDAGDQLFDHIQPAGSGQKKARPAGAPKLTLEKARSGLRGRDDRLGVVERRQNLALPVDLVAVGNVVGRARCREGLLSLAALRGRRIDLGGVVALHRLGRRGRGGGARAVVRGGGYGRATAATAAAVALGNVDRDGRAFT